METLVIFILLGVISLILIINAIVLLTKVKRLSRAKISEKHILKECSQNLYVFIMALMFAAILAMFGFEILDKKEYYYFLTILAVVAIFLGYAVWRFEKLIKNLKS